jgi:hypothetical protein
MLSVQIGIFVFQAGDQVAFQHAGQIGMPVLDGLLVGGGFGDHVGLGLGVSRTQFLQVAVNAVNPGIKGHDPGMLGKFIQALFGFFEVDLGPVHLHHQKIPGNARGIDFQLHLPADEILDQRVDDRLG